MYYLQYVRRIVSDIQARDVGERLYIRHKHVIQMQVNLHI